MQAKAWLASGLMAAVLLGCTDRANELTNQWGCGPVDGLAQFRDKLPNYVLVGEFTETNEAPAAFAEIACHLAARYGTSERPLFVGVSEYLGGATDAESRMRARLRALLAKGAPMVIAAIGGEDRVYSVRQRSKAEELWADAIELRLASAGAYRALLLMPRTDAIAAPIPRKGDRFAGYNPMATFLPEGEVLALEIRSSPQTGVAAPAIRLYPRMIDGFDGQIALATLTRPEVKPAKYEPGPRPSRSVNLSDARTKAVLESGMSREAKLDALEALFETYSQDNAGEDSVARTERGQALRRLAASMIDLHERDLATPRPKLQPVDTPTKDGLH